MELFLIGGFLFFIGIVLLATFRPKTRNTNQRADRGGVVVGKDNKGVIITGSGKTPPAWKNVLLVMAAIATILGTLLVVYQVFLQGS